MRALSFAAAPVAGRGSAVLRSKTRPLMMMTENTEYPAHSTSCHLIHTEEREGKIARSKVGV